MVVHEPTSPAARPATLIYEPPSCVEPLDWAVLFARPQPVEVELGSGDGSFLVEWARRHPDRNFLGVERLKGRLRKLDRKGMRAGLANLRGLRLEAAYTVDYMIPPDSVQAFHLYFPDPWPKRKHERHRLVKPAFAAALWRALKPGGAVYLRTDDPPSFARITEVFRGHAGFEPAQTPPALAALPTDFEQAFEARGLPTWRAAYLKAPRQTG